MYYCVYFSLCRLHYEYILDCDLYISVVTILFIGSRETYSLPYNSYGKNSTTIYLVKSFYGVDHFHYLNMTLHLHKNNTLEASIRSKSSKPGRGFSKLHQQDS